MNQITVYTPAAKRLLAKNAKSLRFMAEVAERTGRPCNGFTYEELTLRAEQAQAKADGILPPPQRNGIKIGQRYHACE